MLQRLAYWWVETTARFAGRLLLDRNMRKVLAEGGSIEIYRAEPMSYIPHRYPSWDAQENRPMEPNDELYGVVRELIQHVRHDAQLTGSDHGRVHATEELIARLEHIVGPTPDMLVDVVARAILPRT